MSNSLQSLIKYQRADFTPESITSLPPNGVFVFGSNPEGRHGAGAAKAAHQLFGAKYYQGEGLQGRSYGIVTKELRRSHPAITLQQVEAGVAKMLAFAAENPHLEFYVTKIGTNLAYFTIKQIGDIFRAYMPLMPPNVVLPVEFV